MRPELALTLERFAQVRQARRGSALAAGPRVGDTPARIAPPLAPGDRVFDTVSGQEGIVEYGYAEVVIVPTAQG